MELLLKLLITHFIGDFFLQPQSWVADKHNRKIRSSKLYFHILIHLLSVIVLLWFEEFNLFIVLIYTISHFIIDVIKLYLLDILNKRRIFLLDQLLHLVVIIAIAQYYRPFLNLSYLNSKEVLLYIASIMFVTYVSAIIIKVLISFWSPETNDADEESLSKAGMYIGILERLFVFSFIITHHWEAVGFLLAAKSVFRFGDLKESKDRMLTEYILIGTLLSFGLAILTGIIHLKMI